MVMIVMVMRLSILRLRLTIDQGLTRFSPRQARVQSVSGNYQ
jgi:hypothetical protein